MRKVKDLTNQQFNDWLVLGKDEEKSKAKKRTYWRCKCLACNETIRSVVSCDLTSGNSKNCGCIRYKKSSEILTEYRKNNPTPHNAKDLTGKIFNNLKVIKYIGSDHNQKRIWQCQCLLCGNICEVDTGSLTSEHTKSCGCLWEEHKQNFYQYKHEDLTNQKFGQLTVLYPTDERKRGQIVWHCICECGNECEVCTSDLKSGHTQSCGCLNSIGESNIQKILQENNIKFEKEKTFDNCVNPETNRKLRYDFYLPNHNRLIEFDGKQHFEYSNTSWNTEEHYEKIKQRDQFKNEYALSNNIELIRIPYWERDNITLDLILENKYLIKEK